MRLRLSVLALVGFLLAGAWPVVPPLSVMHAQNTALNRTTAALLTNKSGGSVSYGDVVILDNTNAKGFTTTTTGALSTRGIGVVLEPSGIANNASGMVALGGWVPRVNLNTSATIGQLLKTHTVAGQATPHDSPQVEGDFGIALQASSSPEAILFGSANGPLTSGASAVTGPGSSTDEAIVRWDGTTGTALQNTSAVTVSDTGAFTFPDDVRQTFNPGANAAGINLGSVTSAPASPSDGDLWYDSTVHEVRARVNSATVTLGRSIVVAASDEGGIVNDTLQNDDELSLSVTSNAVYVLEALLMFTTGTSGTPDAKIGFTYPASATVTYTRFGYVSTATATSDLTGVARYQEASPGTALGNGVISTSTSVVSPHWLRGVVRTGANPGTLTLQWAQNTTTGGTPTVRKADSYILLIRVN